MVFITRSGAPSGPAVSLLRPLGRAYLNNLRYSAGENAPRRTKHILGVVSPGVAPGNPSLTVTVAIYLAG